MIKESLHTVCQDFFKKKTFSLVSLEQAMGVEPTSQAWEARILPMYYACILNCHSDSFYSCKFGGVTIGPKIVFNVSVVIMLET